MTQFIITVTISGRNIENKNKDLQLRQSLKNSFMVAAMVNVINSVIGGCKNVVNMKLHFEYRHDLFLHQKGSFSIYLEMYKYIYTCPFSKNLCNLKL